MRYSLLTLTALLMLLISKNIYGTNWIDYYDELPSTFDDNDSDQYISALTRDEEHEIHSPYITGYKYISGMFFFFVLNKHNLDFD